jgi:SAM-dependent methyltransferase
MDTDIYLMGRSREEYVRLRAQAAIWEPATARVLDEAGIAPGMRCADVGCGPGETMRLMAERVGPEGTVCGIDVDEALSATALDALHAEGHRNCTIEYADVERGDSVPGAPFDLVFARLLLLHVHDKAGVLRRLWDWVAPGGVLVVQDYDLATLSMPALPSTQEVKRVVIETFSAARLDLELGRRLPALFEASGIGVVDGTDVAGRIGPMATEAEMVEAIYRSMLPAAVKLGVTTAARGEECLDAIWRDTAVAPTEHVLWSLLIGTWKRR